MSGKLEALYHLQYAIQLAKNLASQVPDEAPWATLIPMLEKYEGMVVDHWPLTGVERDECRLGWFSVRNIEESFPQLHLAIIDAAHDIRHSGEI
jgi:hypothetical protein